MPAMNISPANRELLKKKIADIISQRGVASCDNCGAGASKVDPLDLVSRPDETVVNKHIDEILKIIGSQ